MGGGGWGPLQTAFPGCWLLTQYSQEEAQRDSEDPGAGKGKPAAQALPQHRLLPALPGDLRPALGPSLPPPLFPSRSGWCDDFLLLHLGMELASCLVAPVFHNLCNQLPLLNSLFKNSRCGSVFRVSLQLIHPVFPFKMQHCFLRSLSLFVYLILTSVERPTYVSSTFCLSTSSITSKSCHHIRHIGGHICPRPPHPTPVLGINLRDSCILYTSALLLSYIPNLIFLYICLLLDLL